MNNDYNFEISGFYIQWHFLESCNLRCLHCYQNEHESQSLSNAQIYHIYMEILKALSKWKILSRVSLTGGEPFLDFEKLIFIMNLIENSNFFYWISILSNGTLIDNHIIKSIKRISKLREVQISIDGGNESLHDSIRSYGSFKRSIRGLEILISAGIKTSIMFTLTKLNAESVDEVISLADSIGVNAITIDRYIPIGNKNHEKLMISPLELRNIMYKVYNKKREFEKKGKKLKIRTSRPLWHLIDSSLGGLCPVGFSSLCIMHDGTVFPCRRLPISIGNLLSDNIFKIWYTSKVLWDIRRKNRIKSECAVCADLGICGGCRAAAYAVRGDYLENDPLCWKYNHLNYDEFYGNSK